jgi:hypothetical protein
MHITWFLGHLGQNQQFDNTGLRQTASTKLLSIHIFVQLLDVIT